MKLPLIVKHPIFLLLVIPCTTAMLPSQACAQRVFKCTVAGKTEYQSSPCAGQGKEIEITSGPTEREMQEAKSRADADKARAATHQAPVQPRPQDQLKVKPIDCAKLNKDLGDAFGRRNAKIRESRADNIDRSTAVNREHEEIRRIESQMVKGGCKPT